MKSHIEIGSICIDLSKGADDDKNDLGNCDHFTIRGYVSEVRKKDWKKCWPFAINEYEEQPSFPPMDVPKFRRWFCQKCLQETVAEVIHGNDKTGVSCRNGCNAVVSSGIQQASAVADGTPVTGLIDLNKPIDPSCDTDCLPSRNETGNNAYVVHNGITDHDIGLENIMNHHISRVSQPQIDPGVINEESTNRIGNEVGIVSNVEVATEEGNVTDHTTGLLSPKPVAFNHVAPVGDIEEIVKNDAQNHNVEKSSGLTRKRTRKTRLLSELVKKNCEPKMNKATKKGSSSRCACNPSTATETPLVSQDNVDVQGDMTLTNKGQERKMNFLVEEESRPGNNEDQNPEGGAKKINTIGKKHKKVQHVDNLIFKPPQGQWKESEGTLDVANKEAPSRSPPSGFFPHASTEKKMDAFPSHLLGKNNDCNYKGKGKMIQADEELDSLSNRKRDKLVEVSSAHTGLKTVSSMPLSTTVPSEKSTPNGELVEGMYLSSKCYSSKQVCNKQSIHQTEIQLPFSLHFQEGTSRSQLIRKDNEINFFREERIPSNHISNAISVNGKGVHLEVINGGGNMDNTAELIVLDSPERYWDLTAEESEHGSLDDVPMEVVEIMARNQYERSLPDVENVSGPLEKSTQRGKHQARDEENIMIRRGENMLLRKGNSINFSPLEENQFGMNNLHTIPCPYGLGVPQSIGTGQHGPAQTSKFIRSIAECGSSGATLQAKGGSNLFKTILQQDEIASLPWAPLTKKVASVGYDDSPEKAVSQPSSSNMDLNSPWSNSQHMRNKKRDIDLNSPNCNIIDLEKLPRTIGSGYMGWTSAEYTFSGKINRIEPHRNQRGPLDFDSSEAIQAMQTLSLMGSGRQSATSSNAGFNAGMIHRPSYTDECITKMEKITSKTHGFNNSSSSDISGDLFSEYPFFGTFTSVQQCEKFRSPPDFKARNLTVSGKEEQRNNSNSVMQNGVSIQLERLNLGTQTPQQHRLDVSDPLQNNLECSTLLNRNPADVALPDEVSPYMISGEDLKIEDSISDGRSILRAPRGRPKKKNVKPSKLKLHENN